MKKYRRGYLCGVFDLYHVGHLNLIRRAKDRCEYLIVGLLTDEMVVRMKKNLPYIPFEERKQILESVRYVDEVVAVTKENHEKMRAWEMYHFDCLFSGNDYAGNPYWEEDQKSLQKVGSNIEFFPYTKSTSSSKIKQVIELSLQKRKGDNASNHGEKQNTQQDDTVANDSGFHSGYSLDSFLSISESQPDSAVSGK